MHTTLGRFVVPNPGAALINHNPIHYHNFYTFLSLQSSSLSGSTISEHSQSISILDLCKEHKINSTIWFLSLSNENDMDALFAGFG